MTDAAPGQIAIRPMRPSPRTPQRPMDFTGAEFFRGLGTTFLVFNLGLPLFLLITEAVRQLGEGNPPLAGAGTLFMVPMYSAPVSALASLTYAGALAFLLGKLLRGEPRRWLHRIAFLGLGALVGYVTSVLLLLTTYGSASEGIGATLLNSAHVYYAVMTGIAVWAGWELTSSRALRADAREAAARIAA